VVYLGQWAITPRHGSTLSAGLQMAQEIGSVSAMLFCLLSTAVLLARQGKASQAETIATLVFHHPSTNRETKDRSSELLKQLALQLPESTSAGGAMPEQSDALEEVIAEILQQLSVIRP
jgi:hypothetical protein